MSEPQAKCPTCGGEKNGRLRALGPDAWHDYADGQCEQHGCKPCTDPFHAQAQAQPETDAGIIKSLAVELEALAPMLQEKHGGFVRMAAAKLRELEQIGTERLAAWKQMTEVAGRYHDRAEAAEAKLASTVRYVDAVREVLNLPERQNKAAIDDGGDGFGLIGAVQGLTTSQAEAVTAQAKRIAELEGALRDAVETIGAHMPRIAGESLVRTVQIFQGQLARWMKALAGSKT